MGHHAYLDTEISFHDARAVHLLHLAAAGADVRGLVRDLGARVALLHLRCAIDSLIEK